MGQTAFGQLRHVKGLQGMEVNSGSFGHRSVFQVNYVMLAKRFFYKVGMDGEFEFGKIKKALKVQTLGFSTSAYYALFRVPGKLYISPAAGIVGLVDIPEKASGYSNAFKAAFTKVGLQQIPCVMLDTKTMVSIRI